MQTDYVSNYRIDGTVLKTLPRDYINRLHVDWSYSFHYCNLLQLKQSGNKHRLERSVLTGFRKVRKTPNIPFWNQDTVSRMIRSKIPERDRDENSFLYLEQTFSQSGRWRRLLRMKK